MNTIQNPSQSPLVRFPEGPNVKTMTYHVQCREIEDGKAEYRLVDGCDNQLGRVFYDKEEAPEVIREWLRTQPEPTIKL